MKYIVPAIIIFIIIVFFTRSMYYTHMKSAAYNSESQYPTAELMIAQGAPQKKFLSEALQSSLGT